jgi:hypothetical protein
MQEVVMKSKIYIYVLLLVCMGLANFAITQTPSPSDAESSQEAAKPERLPNGDVQLGAVRLHRDTGSLSFPATIEIRMGPVEVLVSTPMGRLHEALLEADVSALHLQVMLYLAGLENGARLPGGEVDQGDVVDIDVEWTNAEGETQRRPVEYFLEDRRAAGVTPRTGWVFVGSSVQAGELLADTEGNLVLTWSHGETILDTADPEGNDDTLFTAHTEHLKEIPEGVQVTVVITPR